MNYLDIKTFNERCEDHPDHQQGMVSYVMLSKRLFEEIDELRVYIERNRREWVSLTDEEISASSKGHMTRNGFARAIKAKLKEKNT